MKLSIRERVHNYVITNKDRQIKTPEIAKLLELNNNQVAQALYVISQSGRDLHRIGIGEWIYKPSKKVESYIPLTYRLHTLLSTGGCSRSQIAKGLGVDIKDVPQLVARMNRELQCKTKSETYYTLK